MLPLKLYKFSSICRNSNSGLSFTKYISRSSLSSSSSSSSSSGNGKDNNPKDGDPKKVVPKKDDAKETVFYDKDGKKMSKYTIRGPDGELYDPANDPEFTNDRYEYKYPQYFTKHVGFKRAKKIIKFDIELMKKGRIHPTREELPSPFQLDVLIFGGGIIGSSIAYFLKEKAPFSLSVGVIERDPTYSKASTTLSAGGIRQQFSQPENIQMSMFTADFLRNYKRHLHINYCDPPDVSFTPQGYLTLADESEAEQMLENHKLQIEMGAMVELYTASRLKEKFPFLNLDGVALGSYGVQNEGWFDPWALLAGLKAKAMMYGVEYLQADIIGFNPKRNLDVWNDPDKADETVNHVIIREPDGNVKQIEFAYGVVCAGYNSGEIAKMLGYGEKPGVRSIPFPVEPRKRYVYVFNCRDGPGLNFPFLIDSNGEYCRREGLGGNYICGKSPRPDQEPDVSDLDVDYSFFEEEIHPLLAQRVPAFEAIKVRGGWAGYYDYNTLDQNPIIGQDPYYRSIFWATGFSGHGIQMGPAVGKAMTELLLDQEFKTFNLDCFGWHRILENRPLSTEIII